MSKAVLFDIDDTLIKGGNIVHANAFDFAIKKIFGLDVKSSDFNWSGMVDSQIFVELLAKYKIGKSVVKNKIGELNKLLAEYFSIHHKEFETSLMPGALELIEELSRREIRLGLLTGNVESVAWTKLRGVGVDTYFGFGGFGDMAFVRSKLVEIAANRGGVSVNECILVGDSPRDIQCAKDAGVRIIAVGAGSYKTSDLRTFKPDLLVESLTEKEAIVNYLTNL